MDRRMISVDRWSDGSQAYFLTHLHADHTAGLSPTWNRGPLFCSRTTAKLFPFKFPGFRFSLIRIVDVGRWHSLSLVSSSSGLQTAVEAMAIDAHHCPVSAGVNLSQSGDEHHYRTRLEVWLKLLCNNQKSKGELGIPLLSWHLHRFGSLEDVLALDLIEDVLSGSVARSKRSREVPASASTRCLELGLLSGLAFSVLRASLLGKA
ncbi:hypothetical protein RJ639_002808 [Escallonia herrerae]|uniref:5' exonuclease Apollo n=1 Tax=Escallonia herrerae TaxID=1293975 RepID=A0AA88W017_9ASTE|nr:hypothetical protein RJ639_002808 [Escallonia herrerae]